MPFPLIYGQVIKPQFSCAFAELQANILLQEKDSDLGFLNLEHTK